MAAEDKLERFPSLSEETIPQKDIPEASENVIRSRQPSQVSQSLQEERDQSPGPEVIGIDEAHPDLGDDYGVAAAIDKSMDVPDGHGHTDLSPVVEREVYVAEILKDEDPTENGPEKPVPMDGIGRATSSEKIPLGHQMTDVNLHKMHKFSLYETASRYYLVGGDLEDAYFRVLEIDRTAPPGQLIVVEDEVIHNKSDMSKILNSIERRTKKSGGMKLKVNAWGLLGFIRFTEAYYMLVITKKQQVAMIGGYFVYQVDGTELIPLTTGPASKSHANRNNEEQRFLGILNNLDLHRSFYFSYSYNITQTLQHNIIQKRQRTSRNDQSRNEQDFNDMFVWNHHLLDPALQVFKNPNHWCMPIIHGFIDQSCVDMFGRSIYVTLIARRSRFFAGARFLKRGVNDLGYVANDVETEQIVTETVTTSLNAPNHRVGNNPSYTSFVQHRGSIPLYWTQDNTGVTPKPGIDLNFIDPFYSSAGLHFDNLFERYGAPISVLNLVRARERTPRESKLLVEYQNAIAYLNQPLPEGKKILYRAFDMARAAKTRGQDVIGSLETIAKDLVRSSGFFHNGFTASGETSVQNGVTRSNCIDCLDRTNACQFVIGKTAFALQLQVLGLVAGDFIDYDSDASNILAHMYNDHGDTLASQYGGSHLVNTTDSYRKITNWQSHSRDMLESFKRYYHNSFRDNQRQEAYNLFLGNYRYASGQPMLWELPNDYYLHHTAPSSLAKTRRRNYIKWFTPEFLERRTLPQTTTEEHRQYSESKKNTGIDWWQEYYRPGHLTSFAKTFSYRMNSTSRYLPRHSTSPNFDRSPFVVRGHQQDPTSNEKDSTYNHVGFTDVNSREAINPLSASRPPQIPTRRISSLQQWLHDTDQPGKSTQSDSKFTTDGDLVKLKRAEVQPNKSAGPLSEKLTTNQWTLRQFHENSLNPVVTEEDASEYDRYISHPLRLPLVVSDKPIFDNATADFQEYLEITEHVGNAAPEAGTLDGKLEYERWLTGVPEDPLCVNDGDLDKKRYQAYRKWVRGKSLFKQSKVDPEYGIDI